MTKISKKRAKEIKESFPCLQKLVEREETDYQMIFVSVFDHWLTQDEFEPEIHTDDIVELNERREKLNNFIKGLFEFTPTYYWKYKRTNRFFLCQFETMSQIINRCNIKHQHGESGQSYDIILPEFRSAYCEEWDWTNIIWFRDKEKIKPLIELATKSGLYILEKWKSDIIK